MKNPQFLGFSLQLRHNVDDYDYNLIKHILYREKNISNVHKHRLRTFRTQHTICKCCNIQVFYIRCLIHKHAHKYTYTVKYGDEQLLLTDLHNTLLLYKFVTQEHQLFETGCWDLPSPLSVLYCVWLEYVGEIAPVWIHVYLKSSFKLKQIQNCFTSSLT